MLGVEPPTSGLLDQNSTVKVLSIMFIIFVYY